MPRQINQIQSRDRAREEDGLANCRQREAEPPGKPETEISTLLVAAKKSKKNQQYDECAGFEECDPEQALVLEHDAQPPGRTCRHCGRQITINPE